MTRVALAYALAIGIAYLPAATWPAPAPRPTDTSAMYLITRSFLRTCYFYVILRPHSFWGVEIKLKSYVYCVKKAGIT